MSVDRFLQPLRRSGGTTEPSAGRTSLPPVLLQSLPRRLQIAALTYGAIYSLNLIPGYVQAALGRDMHDFNHWVGPLFILISLGVYFVARSNLAPERINRLGLTFEVFGSFGIAMGSITPYFLPTDQHVYVGIPWTCVWIVAYPLLVPSQPRHSAVAGLLATAVVPLGVQASAMSEGLSAPVGATGEIWFFMVFFNALCAFWGVVGSISINRLGRQVDEARRMGSYQLEDQLGRGGMGEVWRARHRLLARPAAVKLIRPEELGTDRASHLMTRFEREAQATASLRSPHSIVLYDFGTADDGTFYYVMELLEGIDLESIVKQYGPVGAPRVIHWLRQACHSLAEAHALGLIHRDVKPANLYTCNYGLRFDHLKVLDFGLVKDFAKEAGATSPGVTGELALGTPAYIAPEMARGDEVDGRADIYALGCVAYWLLTGKLVFESKNAMEMIAGHLHQEPTPPSVHSELEIPGDLEQIILRCLAKDPNHRQQNALELDAQLAGCRDADAWTQDRARQWWQAHRPHESTGRATPV